MSATGTWVRLEALGDGVGPSRGAGSRSTDPGFGASLLVEASIVIESSAREKAPGGAWPSEDGAARSTVSALSAQDLALLAGREGLGGARVRMGKFTERVIRLSMGRPELITTTADKGAQFAISGFLVYYFCYGLIGLSAFLLGLNGGHHRPAVRAAIILGALLPVSATLLVDLFFATRSNAHPEAIEVTGEHDQELASARERVRTPVGQRNRAWLVGRLIWAVMVGFVISLPVANFFFGHDVAAQQHQDAYTTIKAENTRQDAAYVRDEANARGDMDAISAHYEALRGKAAAALGQHVGALAGLGPSGQRLAVGNGPVESGLGHLAAYYEQQAKQYLASKQLELRQDQTSITRDQTAITALNQKNTSLAQGTTGGLDDDAAIWEYLGHHSSQIPVYLVITLIMVLLDCGVVILKMLTHNSTYARLVAWEEITINYLRAASTMTVIERSLAEAEEAKLIGDLHRTLRSQAISDTQDAPPTRQLYRQLVDAQLRQRVDPIVHNQPARDSAAVESEPTPTPPHAPRTAPDAAIRNVPADGGQRARASEPAHPLPRLNRQIRDIPRELTHESTQGRDRTITSASEQPDIARSTAPHAAPFGTQTKSADDAATRSAGASRRDPKGAASSDTRTDGARERRGPRPHPESDPPRPIAPAPAQRPASDGERVHDDRDLAATEPPSPPTPASTTATPAATATSPNPPPINGRSPGHDEISTRAYFISREQNPQDQVANWLRAEHELATREHHPRARSHPTKPTPATDDPDPAPSGS